MFAASFTISKALRHDQCCNVCYLGFSSVNPTLAIALGAGIGGGGLLVVIIIVIIVVAARRCKKPSSPPPPVPRRFVKTPAPPPESNHPRIYGNQDLDKTPGFSLTESQTTAIDDTESIESIEYEVRSAQACQVLRS